MEGTRKDKRKSMRWMGDKLEETIEEQGEERDWREEKN